MKQSRRISIIFFFGRGICCLKLGPFSAKRRLSLIVRTSRRSAPDLISVLAPRLQRMSGHRPNGLGAALGPLLPLASSESSFSFWEEFVIPDSF